MSPDHQPEGYPTVTPFLIVEGANDLIAFLETTFGATIKEYMTGSDGAVKHAKMRVGDSLVMIADARPPKTEANTTMLYVYVSDGDTAYERALEVGPPRSMSQPTNSMVTVPVVFERHTAISGGSPHM